MSRSVVVMLVAGAILLGILAYVFKLYWPALTVEPLKFKVLVFGLGGYGALLSAVMIRRIVEPGLDMPLLAWLVAGAWLIFRVFHKTEEEKRREEERDRMHQREEPEESSSFGKQGTGVWWAIGLTIVGLGMYGAGIGITHVHAAHALAAPPPPVAKSAPAPEAPDKPRAAPTERVPPKPGDITDLNDLGSAVAVASKLLADNEPSQGSKLLARWLAKRGTWADVSVTKSETSIELVEKDPAAQRGRKLCVAGTLERIEKHTEDGTELHEARLITASQDAVEVYAVGNTGALVKRKPAKFCGVVTGAQREGRSPVTFAVGMFDTNK